MVVQLFPELLFVRSFPLKKVSKLKVIVEAPQEFLKYSIVDF